MLKQWSYQKSSAQCRKMLTGHTQLMIKKKTQRNKQLFLQYRIKGENTKKGILSYCVSWSNIVICRSGNFTYEKQSGFGFEISFFFLSLLAEMVSIATVRPSDYFPRFNFICTSVSEPDLGLKSFPPLFCLTHFCCLFKVSRMSSVLAVSFTDSSL